MARRKIETLSPAEQIVQHTKYKKLRNRVNTIKYNNDRVDKANDENEIWRIVKDKPSQKQKVSGH